MFYLAVLVSTADIMFNRRFIANKKNIFAFISLFISPALFLIPIPWLSSILYAIITFVYALKISPKTIKKFNVFQS